MEEPRPGSAEIHPQRRAGSWLTASGLETVELVKHAEHVEGVLRQSKGFFAVSGVLVGDADAAWALAGLRKGDEVKLWGQLHVHTCDGRGQCLVGSSLPIFEVDRG